MISTLLKVKSNKSVAQITWFNSTTGVQFTFISKHKALESDGVTKTHTPIKAWDMIGSWLVVPMLSRKETVSRFKLSQSNRSATTTKTQP